MMEESVNYKLIEGFPNYKIGDDGTIFSNLIKGSKSRKVSDTWKKLKLTYTKKKRATVRLHNEKQIKTLCVGRLVLIMFVGPCPKGLECCHEDGDFTNNKVDNLRWDTRQENINDMIRHGTNSKGEKHSSAILKESQVVAILEMIQDGFSQSAIAKKFNVARTTISTIKNGRSWKDVRTKEYTTQTQISCHLSLAC